MENTVLLRFGSLIINKAAIAHVRISDDSVEISLSAPYAEEVGSEAGGFSYCTTSEIITFHGEAATKAKAYFLDQAVEVFA